jgi:excisionase family DNA binding protein
MRGPLLTAEQVAERLGLERSKTVLEWARRGELGHYKIGRAVRFAEHHLDAFLASAERRPDHPERLPEPTIPGVVPPNPRRTRRRA